MQTAQAITYYCKYQERCHSEVRNKLYELGCTSHEVEQQITNLIENGLLNEERFAIAFARGKFRMKQWGKNKIRYELKLRKVSDYCINKGITQIDPDEYEKTTAHLIEKKLTELTNERNIYVLKNKIMRYMTQKGYDHEIATELLMLKIKNK